MAHFIRGKDAALEDSIERMQTQLAQLGFRLKEASWLNPVEGCWSVHLVDTDCSVIYTNGKGATELAARASALGEMFERLSCHHFWTHYNLAPSRANAPYVHFPQEKWFAIEDNDAWPEGVLNPELQDFYNPDQSLTMDKLIDFNSGLSQKGICALPFQAYQQTETTWFPVNIIGNLYLSNGMAAGNTRFEARTQALSEVIERYVKFTILRDDLALPDIPEAVIARYPAIEAGIQSLRQAGFGILVKDASLGGEYPVACVTLVHPEDQGVFASFGAHPCFEVALERALTELLQGRDFKQLEGFPSPSFDPEEVASATNLESHFVDSTGALSWGFFSQTPDFEFCDWDFTCDNTEAEYHLLANMVIDSGFTPYIADYEQLGIYACRILVPGMSEIYPVDDLEWENNSVGIALREPILNITKLDDAALKDLLETLNELNLPEQKPIWELLGLAIEAGSPWKTLRVGELKALIGLAIHDEEAIFEGLEWVLNFKDLPAARLQVYRCLVGCLSLDPVEEYETTLQMMFDEATLALAKQIACGECRFFDLNSPSTDLQGFKLHHDLLKAYDKVLI